MKRYIAFDTFNLFKIPLVAAVVYGIWVVKDFLLVLLVALVVSTFIEEFVVRGEKYKIPRIVSVALFYIIGFVLFAGVLVFLVPIIGKEMSILVQSFPQISDYVNVEFISSQIDQTGGVRGVFDQIRNLDIGGKVVSNLSAIFGNIFNAVMIFIVSFYMSIQEGTMDKVLRALTPLRYEDQVVGVWRRTQEKIGSWFRGQLIIALILVVLTYIGLSLISVPYAFLLSLLAGLFGLVPYGIFIALIPAIGFGFIGGGLRSAILVVVMYMLIQQLLDYVLQPIILKKLTGIPSLLVILSVIFGAKLFGVYGLLIAVPMALFGLELTAEFESLKKRKTISEKNN